MVTLATPNAVFMRWLYAKPKEVGVALVIWLPEIRTLANREFESHPVRIIDSACSRQNWQ